MKTFKILIVMCSFVFLVACNGGNDVNVIAKFENTKDIKDGATIYYEGEKIGEVSDVVIRDSGSIIEISLQKSAVKKLTKKSAIVVNRLKKDAPLEIYSRIDGSGEKLQANQEIEGLDSMFQLGAWMIGDVVQAGTDSLSKYVGAFQKYLGSQEFEDSKVQVQEQITDITKSATQAAKSVEQEVTAAIKEFSANEEQIAKTIEQLGDELSPVVSEVARSSTELVGQLEQFISNIESNADLGEQQTGEQFLQSLVNTFEKLNKSIEEGAEQGENN